LLSSGQGLDIVRFWGFHPDTEIVNIKGIDFIHLGDVRDRSLGGTMLVRVWSDDGFGIEESSNAMQIKGERLIAGETCLEFKVGIVCNKIGICSVTCAVKLFRQSIRGYNGGRNLWGVVGLDVYKTYRFGNRDFQVPDTGWLMESIVSNLEMRDP
jgi:hypothetical protein